MMSEILDNKIALNTLPPFQPYFLICKSCYWCATCVSSTYKIEKCPSCNESATIESIPISSYEASTTDKKESEIKEQIEPLNDSIQMCSTNETHVMLFDNQTGETICNKCGVVIKENLEEPDWQISSREHNGKRSVNRTGMPTSLAFHDMGLSTTISSSNIDANGVVITSRQIVKIQRMRRWNKISNDRSSHRNLKNAFTILSSLKHKLSLTDSLVEKSAYIYRKAFGKGMIKGRSISAMVVASIYAACRVFGIPRTLDEVAKAANEDLIFVGKCFRLLVRRLKLNLSKVDIICIYPR